MIRKVTKQHLKEASEKPVYKVVQVKEDGSLISLWVKGTKKSPLMLYANGETNPAYTLTYKPDRVVSDGRYGIWCCETLKDAINQALCNSRHNLCKIYKVLPIGEAITPPGTWEHGGTVLYPAIIMGSNCVKVIDRRS